MQVLDEGWAAYVEVYLMDPDDSSKRNQLYGYTGQVMGGGWDETALNLRLGTVLDAVEGNIPNRVLHRGIVGKIPPSSVAGL
jgi:spore cortex formation protein SpoVR/YcgB (stage V sporulation)